MPLSCLNRFRSACGDPAALATKLRVIDAVLAGEPPAAVASDRHGRISVLIALRQMKSQGHASAALNAWLASFDQRPLTRPTTTRLFIMKADLTRKYGFFDRK